MISKLLLFFYSLCDPLRLEKDSMREEVHSTYSDLNEPYTLTSSSLSYLSSLSSSLSLLVSLTTSLSSLSSGSLLKLLQLSKLNHVIPKEENNILVTLEKEIEKELEELEELGEIVKNKNAIKNKKLFQCFMKDPYVKVDSYYDYVIDLDFESDEEDYSYFVDFYNENEQL
jgi:hypothetical protein